MAGRRGLARAVRVPVAVAAVIAATVGVPAAGARAGTPSAPKVLTVASTGTVDSLNPFVAQQVLATEIHRLTYDFLTNYDPKDFHPIPALATSWTVTPDKLTWTFTIRSGVTWSDGVSVTAGDAAWTLRLMMTNPDAATANGNFVANFTDVSAPDEHTLVVKLARPQATMLALDIPIVPEHVWRAHTADIGTFGNDTVFPVVSDGPFILTRYVPGQYVELSANPRYWRGRPRFDRLVFRLFKDADAEVAALRKGEVDVVSRLTAAQFDSLAGNRTVARNRAPGKAFYALAVNPGATTTGGQAFGDGNPALRDARVRQAIVRAIDARQLVAKTLGGYGEPGTGYLPPAFQLNHWTPPPDQVHGYDPAAANRLLDEAGYRRGAGGKRTTPDGKPFTLRLIGLAQRAADAPNAVLVREWLAAIGVDVSTSMLASGAFGDTQAAGDFDLAFDSWLTNPDPDYALSIQTCAARPAKPGGSFAGDDFVCDPQYDALYTRQLAEHDPTARSALIKQMQQRLYTDGYVNVLYYPDVLEAYRRDAVAGMMTQPQPVGSLDAQDGYWSWWSAAPPAPSTSTGDRGRTVLVAAVAGALVLVAAGAFVLRRRATAGERE